MYDFYPYFTNDGTVGLFSPTEDDIYHSTYGALTESWEKFIIPSGLERYIDSHDSVKILDLCYGIGYNTKTSLQVFINSYLKNKKSNMIFKKNIKNSSKNFNDSHKDIESIDTDNISRGVSGENFKNYSKFNCDNNSSIGAIDGDNNTEEDIKNFIRESINNDLTSKDSNALKNILIDAVDIDKILINLSPFITNGIKNTSLFEKYLLKKYFNKDFKEINNPKLIQVKKIKKSNLSLLPEKYKLNKEVPIILFLKLVLNNKDVFNETILQIMLSQKKYSPFFSKFMLNFARFCSNFRCKYIKSKNKLTFLHNIYYRYVSRSYKSAIELLNNFNFDLNFHKKDAREFITQTDNKYNFIFLDAFTPAKCPALWSLEFFKELHKHLEEDGIILTYSNSAAIRNALLMNGFCIGKIYDENLKRYVGTIASKDSDLIACPLDEKDLALINSKAGICYRDPYLNLENKTILMNREIEVDRSCLDSSSHVLKGSKDAQVESL